MQISRRSFVSLPLVGMFGGVVAAMAQTPGESAVHDEVVKAANAEGSLLIYSIMAAENWKPVISRFNTLYPKIKVETLDLPSASGPFERYLAESATGSRTGDLLFSPSSNNWLDLYRRDKILPIILSQAQGMEKWMMPLPGLYGLSVTPVALVWNNALVPEKERPANFSQFVDLVRAKGTQWRGRVCTYTPLSIFGLTVHGAYTRFAGENAWKQYAALATATPRFERSGGVMVDKILTGEYAAGWFVATSTVWPRLRDPAKAKLLGWSFVGSGQPLLLSAAAIPKGSKNHNSARLMLEFLLTPEGQRLLGLGGLTPIRPGLKPDGKDLLHTYSSVVEAVGGADKIARIGIDPSSTWDQSAFLKRYRKVFAL